MAIRVRGLRRKLNVGNKNYAYTLYPDNYGMLNKSKMIEEAALRSGMSKGVMQACWDAAGEVIKAWITEGHSVPIPGLGSMRIGLRARSAAELKDVNTELILRRRILFTPSIEIKRKINEMGVYISEVRDENGVLVYPLPNNKPNGGNPDNNPSGGGGNKPSGGGDNKPSGGGGNNPSGGDNTQAKKTLKVNLLPPQGGSVKGAGTYDAGSSVTVEATANAGFKFSQWDDGSTSPSRVVKMDKDVTLSAFFTADEEQGGGDTGTEQPGGSDTGTDI